MRKEVIEAKWIQMAGKPNKDFLAKPKRERKRIGNMIIDNAKDKPDLSCTDDINLILQNSVEYYAKLYKHKEICPIALNKLMGDLTLQLEEEEEKALSVPISSKEMLKALVDTPNALEENSSLKATAS
jgi:hypothetical protein